MERRDLWNDDERDGAESNGEGPAKKLEREVGH